LIGEAGCQCRDRSRLTAKDPADRLIAATAATRALPLVTKDARIEESGACEVIW